MTYYDAQGRVEAVADPLGNRTTTIYDSYGQDIAVVDPLNHRTTTLYDSYGRVTGMQDALEQVTSYGLDEVGRRESYTDASGNTTTFVYDVLGRESERIDPLGHRTTFLYDSASQLTQVIDRLGRKREMQYDGAGRLNYELWQDSEDVGVALFLFEYDAVGNQTLAGGLDSSYSLSYDALNRVTQVNNSHAIQTTYYYDAVGNRTQVIDALGGVETSHYDDLRRLQSRTFDNGATQLRIDYSYLANGDYHAITRTSNLAGTNEVGSSGYAYDDARRLTSLVHSAGLSTIADYTWAYDSRGRLTMQVDHGGSPVHYDYDETGQLTGDGTNIWDYDETGNRIGGAYDTDPGNRLATDGVWNYEYDAEGNMTGKEEDDGDIKWVYTYDHRNRMTKVERKSDGVDVDLRVEFRYDAWGNRIEKSVDDDGDGSNNPVVVRYELDGWNPAKSGPIGTENFDVWAEYIVDTELPVESSLTTRYVRGDRIDELFARINDTDVPRWLLADHQGSIRDVLDETGSVLTTISYDAFGNVIGPLDPDAGRYLWTGREWDVEIDLQYNRARYYDPKIGRWMSEDPLSFNAGDSNLYRYVNNAPVVATDPSGMLWIPLAVKTTIVTATWAKKLWGIWQTSKALAPQTVLQLNHGNGASQIGIDQFQDVLTELFDEYYGKKSKNKKAKWKCPENDHRYLPHDEKGRATGVIAFVGPTNVNYNGTGSRELFDFENEPHWWDSLPNNINGLNVPDWNPAKGLRKGWERGHLLAAYFGGNGGDLTTNPFVGGGPIDPKAADNFVALVRFANRSGFATIENEMKGKAVAGECILFQAVPIYHQKNYYPYSVQLRRTYHKEDGTPYITLFTNVINEPPR